MAMFKEAELTLVADDGTRLNADEARRHGARLRLARFGRR